MLSKYPATADTAADVTASIAVGCLPRTAAIAVGYLACVRFSQDSRR